jgi:hypothetical protein
MMNQPFKQRRHIAGRPAVRAGIAFALALCVPGAPEAGAAEPTEPPPRLDPAVRDGLQKVVVVPGAPGEQEIGGSYEKVTKGLYGGVAAGSVAANPATQVGPVTVSVPIPVLALPGMIAGGIAGVTEREIQEFRDALTEELADASRQPINNDKLARSVYQQLRTVGQPAAGLLAPTTTVPPDTDAVLYVDVVNLAIDVDGEDAVLRTTGRVTIERRSDGTKLYERSADYEDRASLGRWTADDNQLIEDYANYAMHYLGRELAAETFAGAGLSVAAEPAKSASVDPERRNLWRASSRAISPELAWTPAVTEGVAPPDAWDVEVYDAHRLLYSQQGVAGTSHTLATPLAPCGTYRWSVRPAWRSGGASRSGDWMRAPGAAITDGGIKGRDAAAAPAYIQDFATIEIHCKAR